MHLSAVRIPYVSLMAKTAPHQHDGAMGNPAPDSNNETNQPRSLSDLAAIFFKGMAMGSVEVVPGVSGGTVALIFGIYEELILSLKSLASAKVLRALARFRLREAWQAANGTFLLTVLLGNLIAVVAFARLLGWLLANQPVLVWSFFFGLIAAAITSVAQRAEAWPGRAVLTFVFSTLGMYLLVDLAPAETPETYWFLFLSGAIAVCALILPGVSGAFVLVLLGKYEFIVAAVNQRDFTVILAVGLGMVVGILSFVQLLSWLFKRYYNTTIALLCGVMLGSLRRVWPWKEVLEDRTLGRNTLPSWQIDGAFNSEIGVALVLALLGAALVLLVDRSKSSHN